MFAASKTASVSGGYQISRSLRFNSADSAYLNRTPASASNRKTWTWSGWVKRSALNSSGENALFIVGTSLAEGTYFNIAFSSDKFVCGSGAAEFRRTTAVYRDVSAWYHLVVAVDTTQATEANRVRMYVNGVEVTAFDTNVNPTQNTDLAINSTVTHNIGRNSFNSSNFFSGYMTEMNLIDGQALTPSSFGETNAQTGVWTPKAYSGSYGTNGFYLNFSDNSNTTATTLGKDYSGNGNNWTPNNFSVTAGAGNDSLVDSPTAYGFDTGVGGTVRGNYATLNPLVVNKPTLTNGNLDADGSDLKTAISTMGVSSGKWYWEVLIGSGTNTPNMGVTSYANDNADPGVYLGVGRSYVSSGGGSGIYKPYTATSTTANSAFSNANTAGATIGFALDCDAGTLAYYVNNVLGYTDSTIATGTLLYPMTCNFNSTLNNYRNTSFNFGQRPFAYTAPSGYKALCTQNLPTPTIGATTATQAGKYFGVTLRTGGAPSGGTYTTTVDMSNGALLWDKARNQAQNNYLVDSNRGLTKFLQSNATTAESTQASWYTSFGDGTYSTGSSDWGSGVSLVDWIWAAGANTTNTAGSITSTVSANTTSGFSIVTFTTDGTTKTVGHGLGVAPKMIIVKQRNGVGGAWYVFTTVIDGTYDYLSLNTTDAAANSSYTAPTATVFEYNDDNAATQVAYCFAEVAGYSKFGSYTGNGSTDGPFVYCGFRPAYVMFKNASVSGSWEVYDTTRNTYNTVDNYLLPNVSDAEGVATNRFDYLSNGVKVRNTGGSINGSGNTIIFMAFASNPFKYSLAR